MSTASQNPAPPPTWVAKYEAALAALDAAKDRWAQCPIAINGWSGLGFLLTAFQYRPSWSQLPRIFVNALLG